MKTPLAWKNLTHNRVRTAIGVAGVGFAVILIFMQMGFLGAIARTATQIYDALEFDLMVRSPAYLHLTEPRTFPRARLHQALVHPDVEKARPFYLGLSEWQVPQKAPQRKGEWRGIITMGTDPYDPVFKNETIRDKARQLTNASFVIVDDKSKADYGPANGKRFSQEDLNEWTSLGPNNRVEIRDLFTLGTGMASNGACMTSPEGYVRACPWQSIDDVNFGLLKLSDDADTEAVRARLQKLFGIDTSDMAQPAAFNNVDVAVLTPDEVRDAEKKRWVQETPLGKIFLMGVIVAMFVGVAIVYQVLSTDIANMMGEYATLKAMGYSNRYLTTVVLQQSVMLAIVGYVPSILISWGLYWLVEYLSGMPMAMTWGIAIVVLLLAIAICVISGMAALRKLYQADPADLF